MRDCCKSSKKNKKCIRKDGKTFSLPRRFSKKKCLTNQRGFTMRASCAPYKFCKKSKKNKIKGKGREYEVRFDELPFLLKEVFSKKGVYEPGLVDKILTNIPKKSYAESIKYRKMQDQYRKIQDQLKNKNEELEEIERQLQNKKVISSNGPSTNTHAASKKTQQSEYIYSKLNNRKKRIKRIKREIDTLNLRLQLFEFYPYS